MTTCGERVQHWYLMKLCQLSEIPFHKLYSCGIFYTDNQSFFNNKGNFDFESIYVGEKKIYGHRNNNMDWEAHRNFGIGIVQLDTRTHFPL